MSASVPQEVERLLVVLERVIERFRDRAEDCKEGGAGRASTLWNKAAREVEDAIYFARAAEHDDLF